MTDNERCALHAELTERIMALNELGELPWLGEAKVVTVSFADGEPRRFDVNAATRPLIEALLAEEKARLEALALGIRREVAP